MHILRTALVSALLGVSMSSFAALPASEVEAREARMQQALQQFRDKEQARAADAMTSAKPIKHSKNQRQVKKQNAKAKADAAKAQ